MSSRAQSRQRAFTPPPDRQLTKNEKRAAARAAAARLAAARKRRRALLGVAAGLVVVAVVFGLVIAWGGGKGGNGTGSTPSSAPAASATTPGATTPGAATDQAFPPLPAGADPVLRTRPTVKAGTGELTTLTVTPLVTGAGAAAQAGQQITVNYVGVSYRTGEEFDASWNRSQPYSFALGGGSVIPGWDQGLVGVKVGSRVQLDIPSNLAYGDNPGGGRPAGPLRFVVDVLATGA